MSAICQSVLSVTSGVITPTDSSCDPSTAISIVDKLTQEYTQVRELEETTHNQLQEVRRLTNVCFTHVTLLIKTVLLHMYVYTYTATHIKLVHTCTVQCNACTCSFFTLVNSCSFHRYRKTVLVYKRPQEAWSNFGQN